MPWQKLPADAQNSKILAQTDQMMLCNKMYVRFTNPCFTVQTVTQDYLVISADEQR